MRKGGKFGGGGTAPLTIASLTAAVYAEWVGGPHSRLASVCVRAHGRCASLGVPGWGAGTPAASRPPFANLSIRQSIVVPASLLGEGLCWCWCCIASPACIRCCIGIARIVRCGRTHCCIHPCRRR